MTSKKTTNVNTLSPGKLRLVFMGLVLAFCMVGLFLFRWQVLDHEKYSELAASRYFQQETKALRGDILARDNSILSYSEPRFDVFVYKNAKHGLLAAESAGRQTRQEFLQKVSKTLEMSQEELSSLLDQDSQWIKIADKVNLDKKNELIALPTEKAPDITLDGILFEESSERIYPEDDLAAHVLGFLGKDEFGTEVGAAGIEQYFHGVLRPQSGISSLETDSNQNIIAISNNQIREARRGAAVRTTIDKNLQRIVQKQLAQSVERFSARSGSVIIMDPRTGEILAMANYPDFSPKEYFKADEYKILGNSTITTPYEIGSVGKIFTMAAAVDQGKVDASTIVINGHKGCQEIIEGRIICTYDKKPQGPMTSVDAMIKSDNLALFATASLIGEEKLAQYLENFGMGRQTGIQLSGEDSGFIKPYKSWNQADLATYSYGHSYTQTALQSIVGVSALANKGNIMEPMIVSQIIDEDGRTRTYTPKPRNRVLTESGTQKMAEILNAVYKSNIPESKYQHLGKYKIGMKSGTATIPFSALANPIDKAGYSNEVNSTYVGYDASEQNTFVMLVNLSEPQTNPKVSFNNARYLWLDIFDQIKDIIGVPVSS